MTPTPPKERYWLDGPKLVEWLTHRGCKLSKDAIAETGARRIRDWRTGSKASVFSADAVLVRLEIHLHELPDELYLASDARAAGPYPAEVREEAVRRVAAAGESINKVARSIGCHRKSVATWVRAAA